MEEIGILGRSTIANIVTRLNDVKEGLSKNPSVDPLTRNTDARVYMARSTYDARELLYAANKERYALIGKMAALLIADINVFQLTLDASDYTMPAWVRVELEAILNDACRFEADVEENQVALR